MSEFPHRLGYACLNTVLRAANPSVFCSRTARISTLEKGDDVARGLGRLNVLDLLKIIQWNEDHNIRFMRISSVLFPFASHEIYGYSLEYCKDELKQVGDLAKRLSHRLTLHPGQTNNLGSPLPNVIEATRRDLMYHTQMLELMELDQDSVMIIHGGGVYGDKLAALERWETNFKGLGENVRNRLVLENDEICYSTEDLLPMCERLDIPLVFDWHHHRLNPGVVPLGQLLERIKAIWVRRGIRQKMHYSESCLDLGPNASLQQRRKHSDFVQDIVCCGNDIDLMIEAKMKEQAVFHIYDKYSIRRAKKLSIPREVIFKSL